MKELEFKVFEPAKEVIKGLFVTKIEITMESIGAKHVVTHI
jgi:hypothetical protein